MPTIEGSRRFLCSYMKSLINAQHHTIEKTVRGKQPICYSTNTSPVHVPSTWTRPPEGFVKLNTDGSFV
jgi:hypothetical protein